MPDDGGRLRNVAGIDEAGRGSLAGPVVAAAVILPRDYVLDGLTDSKLLTPKKRARLEQEIRKAAIAWSLGVVWPALIDKINILQATFLAMARAASSLRTQPDLLLIDGKQIIPESYFAPGATARPRPFMPGQKAIVRGDLGVPAISAASILAKTFRDRVMTMLDRRYSGYGFALHKGYGTRVHMEALARLGPCAQHRLSFRWAGNSHAPASATLMAELAKPPA